MDHKVNGNELRISLSGRIDSTNAEAVGAEVGAICEKEAGGREVVFDAEGLEYISSAGLRMVLKYRKLYPSLRVTGASSEVYEIFEMTGFTEMIPIEKAFRRLSVDGCPIIGRGAKGTVYRYNEDTIVKVYKNPDSLPDIQREREFSRRAFVLGIPTAISYDIVRVGESYGSVFELLNARSYSALIAESPEKVGIYARDLAELLRKIHDTRVKPGEFSDVKERIDYWLFTTKGAIGADAEKISAMVRAVSDEPRLIHGDFHSNNVMLQGNEALIIDMDTLSAGHPVFELANVYITYVGFGIDDPTMVENFIGLPYALSVKFWELFLPAYLGTDDPERIARADRRIRLLSELRLLHHTIRRGGESTEAGKKLIARASGEIHRLLETVDSLADGGEV